MPWAIATIGGGTRILSALMRFFVPAFSRASSTARVTTSPSTISSRMPMPLAGFASFGLPSSMNCKAICTPPKLSGFFVASSRGKRCVPPAPGMRPSKISGRPTLEAGVAIR